ncbi:MAG TPA: hypothetical protein VLV15_08780, partial [Dongiaceae bacterium]|nr:hypothetical protein [Dongiaceae bacterium]
RALPADSVDLWQAITIFPSGDGARLAGGNPRVRLETMAYQPTVLRDGTLVGVRAEHPALTPDAGRLLLQDFPTGFAEARWLIGDRDGGSACAPAEIPDGRILFSYDPEGRGDFGLYVIRPNGGDPRKVVDLPGTLELDGQVLAAREAPPEIPSGFADFPRALPSRVVHELKDSVTTFRFDCLNVFANAPIDAPIPDAPPAIQGLRIRFYATLARPEAPTGDTLILLRETPVDASGAVHEHELPADTPMFEQLIDAHGHVLRSTMGPAHVPGFNAGRFGSGTKCVGCHIGHSAIPVAPSAHEGKRFNISPSAEVTVTSTADSTAGPRALVDRRSRGPSEKVAWVSADTLDQHVRLAWASPVEVDTLVIYAISPQSSEGTDLRVQDCELAFYLDGRVVEKRLLQHELAPAGTRVDCKGIRIDALEV